jgi:hypothetical protein
VEDGAQRLRDFWARAVRLAQISLVGGAAVLYLCLEDGRAAALGLLLGGATSILRFRLRYKALLGLRAPGPLVRMQLLSYALNGAVLAAAFALRDTVSPWATVAGLFVMNVSVIASEILTKDEPLEGQRLAAGGGP